MKSMKEGQKLASKELRTRKKWTSKGFGKSIRSQSSGKTLPDLKDALSRRRGCGLLDNSKVWTWLSPDRQLRGLDFPMQALVEPIPGSNSLNTFCSQDGRQREFTGELRSILEVIAKTGKYWHDWSQLKSLLCYRLAQVMQEYHASDMHVDDFTAEVIHGERFPDVLDRLLQGLESFTDGAPFTCQRLCELLLNPKDTYVNLDKLSLAFEKLLLVTSTEPASTDPYPSAPQPSTKDSEVQQTEQMPDEILPELLTVNGSHKTNGSDKDFQDDEMVDVEGVGDRPVAVVAVESPVSQQDIPVHNDTPQNTAPEESANGHVSTSGVDRVVGDILQGETKPE